MKKIRFYLSLFMGILFLVGCQSAQEEKSSLVIVVDDYLINELDEFNDDELSFVYHLANNGYKEAKNIEIECVLYDNKDNVVARKRENIGNVAAASEKYGELATSITGIKSGNKGAYSPDCTVISCDGC